MHPQAAGSDTQLEEVAEAPDSHAAIQRDLDRLENWAERNLMKFNQGKYKVLPLGEELPHAPGPENHLGILTEDKLDMI